MLVAEQHGEPRVHHALGQAADALAGDRQIGLVLGLVMTDLGGAEHVVHALVARVEAVLGHTAVPGLGDDALGADAALGEVAVDEGSQLAG